MDSQNCIFDQINNIITKNQDSSKLNGSNDKPSSGSSYKNYQTGSTVYSNQEESKKLNDDPSTDQFSKIDSIINRQQLHTKNSNMFRSSQENLKKIESEHQGKQDQSNEEKQNGNLGSQNNKQDNLNSNSQNLMLQHTLSLNKQLSNNNNSNNNNNNNGNMNYQNIGPSQFYNSFNLYPNDINDNMNFGGSQGNNQLQNSYMDLVKMTSMNKKNDMPLPQLNKLYDSFLQVSSNNNGFNSNTNKNTKNLNGENNKNQNQNLNTFMDFNNQQIVLQSNKSQEFLKQLENMQNQIQMFNQKNQANNPYLNLSGSIKLASSYNGGTISNQNNGKNNNNNQEKNKTNEKEKKDNDLKDNNNIKENENKKQENEIKNSKINNELTYSQRLEGEDDLDDQQQQLELSKKYSLMQGFGFPYRQVSFNFFNNDQNNINNNLTNSFNQNYSMMDQQIFADANNKLRQSHENLNKFGEQPNKKLKENPQPFEYNQFQQQQKIMDQLRSSFNGGNTNNSMVLNNNIFQNMDLGMHQQGFNGNNQLNNPFMKQPQQHQFSKFKTQNQNQNNQVQLQQLQDQEQNQNQNNNNNNNEVFSSIGAIINKQQKNNYYGNSNNIQNICIDEKSGIKQKLEDKQDQLGNLSEKKRLVKEEEDEEENSTNFNLNQNQRQINLNGSGQKSRITKSSQIQNDVDINEENIEEKIKKIQDKLKKENELLLENDKETGKRRNQRVWNEDEDFLLKYFHKKYKGKWDLIAKEIPGRNSSQSLQRYRKFNNQKSGRSHWNQEEDRKVLQMIKQFGKNWGLIASNLKNRSGKQVRERYINCLDPSINWGEFTPEEDRKIIDFVKLNGPKWSLISRQLQGRPENMLKNRYYAHLKRLEEDKCGEGRKSKKGQKQITKEEEKNEMVNNDLMENLNCSNNQPLLTFQTNSFLQPNLVDN